MRTVRLSAALLAASVLISACGVDVAVTATRSDLTPADISTPPTPTTLPDPPVTTVPNTDPGPPTSTVDTGPGTTAPIVVDPGAIDFGPNKPERPYDDFLLATLTDLDAWWTDTYPLVYGAP